MKPNNIKSKIFLDSGDPNETKQVIGLLGFLDGQTTNPTLIFKNPKATERLARGEKFSEKEIFDFYKTIVQKISGLIPEGSVSVEVPADKNTSAQEMLDMGRKMFSWIPNAHIKFPTNAEGLTAAEQVVKKGMRVNMTLMFSQEQAASVYSATRGAKKGQVIISPFIGRLDDKGINGMSLVENIIKMFKNSDHHVAVLTASVRNLNHFLYALLLGSDIITAPFSVLKEWVHIGLQTPDNDFIYNTGNLKSIPYQNLDLNKDWRQFNIDHELTDAGIEKFSNDWDTLIT